MTGYKKGLAGEMQLTRAIRWMRTLNKDAAEVLRGADPSAVTEPDPLGQSGTSEALDRGCDAADWLEGTCSGTPGIPGATL